jgi:2'-5' RNA ligase
MKLGIAFLPNIQMIKNIIKLQEEAAQFCVLKPVLGEQKNSPHITLFQGEFSSDRLLDEVILELRNYCLFNKYSLKIQVSELEYVPIGWYFLKLDPNSLFRKSHDFVFEKIKNEIQIPADNAAKNISSYTELEKSNYLKYGYRYVGDAFNPHITFGRTDSGFPSVEEGKLRIKTLENTDNLNGYISKITVYKMGENGSHEQSLYSINIQ